MERALHSVIMVITMILTTVSHAAKHLDSSPSANLPLITLDDRDFASHIGESVHFMTVEPGSHSLDSIRKDGIPERFRPVGGKVFSSAFAMGDHWFVFDIANQLTEDTDFWLMLEPVFDFADLYILDRRGRMVQRFRSGAKVPVNKRPIKGSQIIFPLDLETGETYRVLLKLQSAAPVRTFFYLSTPENFISHYEILTKVQVSLLSVMLLVALYSIIIWLASGATTYLLYALHVLANFYYFCVLFGISSTLVPDSVISCKHSALAYVVSFLVAPLFVASFLGRSNKFRYKTQFYALSAIFTLIFLMATIDLATAQQFMPPLLVIFLGLTIYHSIKLAYRGWRPARLFLAGMSTYAVGVVIFSSEVSGLIEPDVWSLYIIPASAAVEFVIISLALGLHTREVQMERNRLAKEQKVALERTNKLTELANLRLESEVNRRTRELQDALKNLETANRELALLSQTDKLTGLKNRHYFNQYFAGEFRRSIREQTPVGLIIMDIDHFKAVNDTYGHVTGDTCLQQVAEVIKRHMQRPGDCAVRFGGEEFVVVLDNTDITGTLSVAEAIHQDIMRQPMATKDAILRVTASFGVTATIPQENETPEEMIKEADNLLYRAKRNGRNKIECSRQSVQSISD
ncbi:MAG: diguanylate cyclase [Ketobacteraceae bacterium]|nr:diguanylate cyclase [Ketobacteraceae bacterium]